MVCLYVDRVGAAFAVYVDGVELSSKEAERDPTEPHEVGNQHGSSALKPQVGDQSVDGYD